MKDYWTKELRNYLIANIFTFLWLSNLFSFDGSLQFTVKTVSTLINSSLVSAALFAFPFVLDACLGSVIKGKLLFCFGHQPGEKIFSAIKSGKIRDIRFTKEQALKKYASVYSQLPSNKKARFAYENAEWYRVYHHVHNSEIIKSSNKEYLLLRDMHIATYSTMAMYTILVILSDSLAWSWPCFLFETGMLVLTNIAARNKATRFVLNVLAFDMQEQTLYQSGKENRHEFE